MARLVWTPDGGTFQVVRNIRDRVESATCRRARATDRTGSDPRCSFNDGQGNERYPTSIMENTQETSTFGSFGKRVIAWIVIAAALVLALKLIIGAVLGFVTFLITVVLVVGVIAGVIWALRHI
jgi:hypothetical protein